MQLFKNHTLTDFYLYWKFLVRIKITCVVEFRFLQNIDIYRNMQAKNQMKYTITVVIYLWVVGLWVIFVFLFMLFCIFQNFFKITS